MAAGPLRMSIVVGWAEGRGGQAGGAAAAARIARRAGGRQEQEQRHGWWLELLMGSGSTRHWAWHRKQDAAGWQSCCVLTRPPMLWIRIPVCAPAAAHQSVSARSGFTSSSMRR